MLDYIRSTKLGRYLSLFSIASAITSSVEAGIRQEPQDTVIIVRQKQEYRVPMDLLDELQTVWGIENGRIEVWPHIDPNKYLLHGEETFERPKDYNKLGKVAKMADENGTRDFILTAEEIQKQIDKSAMEKLRRL